MCHKKHLELVSCSFFLPYPIPWTHPSFCNTTLGRFIHRWGNPKEGVWRWEPQHQETWSPQGFSKLFQPRGSTSFGCSRYSFTVGGSSWNWRLWARAENRLTRSMGQGSLAGISSQLRQPHDCPSLGTKPAQALGMCQQPRAPRPEGNRVNSLFS